MKFCPKIIQTSRVKVNDVVYRRRSFVIADLPSSWKILKSPAHIPRTADEEIGFIEFIFMCGF
jgi:hypothetical protein